MNYPAIPREFFNGDCFDAYRILGAHPCSDNGTEGWRFAVWAPGATAVEVCGGFDGWEAGVPMEKADTGVWSAFVPGLAEGDLYKYRVHGADGSVVMRSDPYAFSTELRPGTASRLAKLDFHFDDSAWMERRDKCRNRPLNIYEMHVGSWRHKPGSKQADGSDGWYNYEELAKELIPWLLDHHFTHVELLPPTEHPYDGSWGYQVTGYYAPSSRYGSPHDFMALVDALHEAGIGVIMDWVPAHFPKDEFGLYEYDGACCYEYSDPAKWEHKDWGTRVFDFGRTEVQSFLTSSANFWAHTYHIDGIRVDAVASMLYLDYGKSDGEWLPNKDGGNEHYEAIHFLQHLNSEVEKEHPGAYIIAEESTAWPGVTAPVADGGLGFSYKWNMGWMNDFLEYMKLDPYFRKDHQSQLCFSIEYYTSEKYILVLSHDEVVHGKCSLLNKMSGLEGDKFASLRAAFGFMYGHPGKKLLFMGQEFAQKREWAEFRSLDWFLLEEDDRHKKMQDYVRELNHLYQKYDALYYHDFNVMGFEWMDCWRPELSTVAFVRRGSSVKDQLMFIANFTPMALEDYQVNAPCAGTFTEILNSDEERFGGEGRVNKKPIQAKPCKAPVVPRPGEKIKPGKKYYELELYVPPLSVVVLRYDYKAE